MLPLSENAAKMLPGTMSTRNWSGPRDWAAAAAASREASVAGVGRAELGLERVGDRGARLEQVHDHEPDGDSNRRRGEVDQDRLAADARELAEVAQRGDAEDERGEDERDGDELQRVEEDGPERRDPIGRELPHPFAAATTP